MNKLDIIAISVLFIVAFYFWTLPIQDDPRPFGEGDAAWHFSIGDYISSSDKPIWRLPFYIGQWYYGYNPVLGPNAPEYPPSNHYNYALMQAAGGERFVPIIMYRAIASFLGIFAVYFLVRKLYGTPAAMIASSGIVFSVREQLIYLWGQQPTLISIVFAPVTFYAFYRYLDSYYRKENKVSYLYVTALLLASQYLLHIQGFTLSVIVLAFFTLLMFLKHRRLPFVSEGKKHLAAAAVIFLIIAVPFIMIYFGTPQLGVNEKDYSRLFSWGVKHELVAGSYPEAFTSFSAEYPKILLPFLFVGILFLLLRRKNRDLLMLGWLLAMYVVLHADIFIGTSVERAARMLVSEPPLFYSLIGIGAVSLVSFVKLPSSVKSIAQYSIAAILVIVIVGSSASEAKDSLSMQYQSIFRITPVQSELASWLHGNLDENAYVYYMPENRNFKLGTWQYQKLRWILASSQRHVASFSGTFANNSDVANSKFYFVFDYSDLALLASGQNPWQTVAQQNGAALQKFEQDNFNASGALYSQNNIRVYEVEPKTFQ